MDNQNYTLQSKPTTNWTWIYHETLYSPDLSFGAKGLWCYINSKPLGWQFSSQRIAEETKEAVGAIQRLLRELIGAKLLIAHKHSDGHITYELTGTFAQSTNPKRQNAVLASISKKDKSLFNKLNKDGSDEPMASNVEKSEEQDDKRNPDINEMFEYWESKMHYPIKSNAGKNRMACYNLLRRKDVGKERLKSIIDDLRSGKQYPPQCSDFLEMQSKWNKIEAWQLRLKPKKISNSREILERKYKNPEPIKEVELTEEQREANRKMWAEMRASLFNK